MVIFDSLKGNDKSDDSVSTEELQEMIDNPNIEIKINTNNLPESPVKSIDDLDLDSETMEKIQSMTVKVGEDGILPKDQEHITEFYEKRK